MDQWPPEHRDDDTPLRAIVAGVLVVVVAVWLVGLAAAWVRTVMPADPRDAEIRSTVEGALRALYYDDFPPADYRGGPLPSAVQVAIRSRVTADIERYFTAPLQARYTPLILAYVETIGRTEWDAAGDLGVLDWTGVTIDADHATLSVRVSGWVVRRGGQDGREPTATHRLDSTWDWRFGLDRLGGQWRVASLDSTCVAGCP